MIEGFRQVVEADRRLALLRLLRETNGQAGESVLQKGLVMLGHTSADDRDEVRADLRFLQDADCLIVEMVAGKIMVAKLTRRGVSAANGVVEVEGVAKPTLGL